MAQNKISRRSFLRGAGASATIVAASCMAPSAAACDIKSLWSMDLMSQAAAEGAMQLAAAMVADAPAPRRKLRREILF